MIAIGAVYLGFQIFGWTGILVGLVITLMMRSVIKWVSVLYIVFIVAREA